MLSVQIELYLHDRLILSSADFRNYSKIKQNMTCDFATTHYHARQPYAFSPPFLDLFSSLPPVNFPVVWDASKGSKGDRRPTLVPSGAVILILQIPGPTE